MSRVVERWLKCSRFVPLRLVGEVLFGTWGEVWEEHKRVNDML